MRRRLGPITGKGNGYCVMRLPDNSHEPALGFVGLSGRPVRLGPGSRRFGAMLLKAEAEKIAALVERIRPARVQLNTVCRPPAERSARPLFQDDMQHLKVLFQGQVDVISRVYQEEATHSASFKARREDVLALLRRRPCTVTDIRRIWDKLGFQKERSLQK